MIMEKRRYKVAGHVFVIAADSSSQMWEAMKSSYSPFETTDREQYLFTLQ